MRPTSVFSAAILACCTLLLVGCSSLRTSSRDHLVDSSSQLQVAADEQETASRVEQVFRTYGLKLVARKPHGKGGTLQVFTGIRKAVPRASFAREATRYDGDARGGMIVATTSVQKEETDAIGSALYVLLTPGPSGTRVKMLGKPMLNGTPVCSDEDAAWGLGACESPRTSGAWEGAALMTGREEAHVIQTALRDLRRSVSVHPPRAP